MCSKRTAHSAGSIVITNQKQQKYFTYQEFKTDTKHMWNAKANVILLITGGNRNHLRIKWKAQTSRNYRKPPYDARHSYFGKY
jgi:hypothetical protein